MLSLVKDKSFYKKIAALSIPIAGQQLLTAGVNMIDTLMVGQLDEVALSAVSMASQVQLLFIFISLGTGIGASIMLARYWGGNNTVSIKKTITLAFRFILVLGIVYTILVGFFPRTVMQILTTEDIVIEAGIKYLKWSIPCYLMIGIPTICNCILRNIGKVRISLYISIGAFVVNIFFNWIFIFGKLGMPRMEVAGAAIGTMIARAFETIAMFVYLFIIDKTISYRIKDLLTPCRDLAREFFKVTIPTVISDTLVGLGMTMCTAVGGRISVAFMSGNSITAVMQQLISIFSHSFSSASQIIIGNTLGEGRKKDVKQEGFTLLLISAVLGLFVGICIFAFTVPIVNGYKLSTEAHDVAIQLMYGQAIVAVVLLPSCELTKGILRGGGDTRFLMLAEVLFLWVLSIPLGYITGVILRWSPLAVFLFLRIDHLCKLIWCLLRFRTDKWIKKIQTAD